MHYVGVFESYTKPQLVREDSVLREKSVLFLPLLSISPIQQVTVDDKNNEEATSFDVEVHFKFFATFSSFMDRSSTIVFFA